VLTDNLFCSYVGCEADFLNTLLPENTKKRNYLLSDTQLLDTTAKLVD
jgi:hypothetical protein